MKFAVNANWLLLQEQRLAKIKWLQKRKITSELPSVLKVKGVEAALKTKRKLRIQHVKNSILRRGTKKDYQHSGTFQEAIRPVLVLAQVFALLPVKGVTSKSAHDLKFSWLHMRTIYSMMFILCFGICSIFTIAFVFRNTFNFDSVETIIFYTSIVFISSAFLNLARKWPALMIYWEDVERKLPPMYSEVERGAVAHHTKIITLVATMCSLVEHLLSMLSLLYYVNACPAIPDNPIDSYFYTNLSQFFYFVNYNTFAGIVGKVLNVISTFAWNFNDIFVMVVSVGISSRFRQLNEYMLKYAKRPTTEQFWIENRVNYRNLCKLCDLVDDTISVVTFLCLANNLYFICSKILKSLQKKPSFTHTLYFWFSLAYLLCRTFVLSIYTSQINDESKRPLVIFRTISHKYWCPELRRFSEEIASDVVALSGLKFFHLTRSLVLSVAGTIVTYELVLLQFNKDDRINDCNEY